MNKTNTTKECECGVSVNHTHGPGGLKDVIIPNTPIQPSDKELISTEHTRKNYGKASERNAKPWVGLSSENVQSWEERLVTILPLEHATLEVHNILFQFISELLTQAEEERKDAIEAMDAGHKFFLAQALASERRRMKEIIESMDEPGIQITEGETLNSYRAKLKNRFLEKIK